MKIVLVENNKQIQNQVKNVLRKIDISEKEDDLTAFYFSEYNLELKNMINRSSERKIYIISADLANNTGLKLGTMLRDVDWDSDLIFITSNPSMFETIHHKVHNVYDILKKDDNLEANLFKAIKDIYQKKYDHQMFRYKSRDCSIQIYLSAILYIYRDKEERKIIIHTSEQDYMMNLSLAEALKRLDSRFYQVHRGCIANLDHIRLFNWSKGYFTLKDNKHVYMLSKKFKKEVTKIYDEHNNHNN